MQKVIVLATLAEEEEGDTPTLPQIGSQSLSGGHQNLIQLTFKTNQHFLLFTVGWRLHQHLCNLTLKKASQRRCFPNTLCFAKIDRNQIVKVNGLFVMLLLLVMTKWFHDKFHHLTCKVKKNCLARSAVFLEASSQRSVANVISIFRPKNHES